MTDELGWFLPRKENSNKMIISQERTVAALQLWAVKWMLISQKLNWKNPDIFFVKPVKASSNTIWFEIVNKNFNDFIKQLFVWKCLR